MIGTEARQRAMKGLLYSKWIRFRRMLYWFPSICLAIFIMSYSIGLILSSQGIENNYSGSITIGAAITLLWLLYISIQSAAKSEFRRNFMLPMNRKIYVAGQFLFLVIGSAVLLGISFILQMFEIVVYKLTALLFPDTYIINWITLENTTAGVLVSWSYIVFICSLIYLLVLVMIRKTGITLIIAAIFGVLFTVPMYREGLYQMLCFIVLEQSVALLIIKLWTLAVIFQILGYRFVRRLEVTL